MDKTKRILMAERIERAVDAKLEAMKANCEKRETTHEITENSVDK